MALVEKVLHMTSNNTPIPYVASSSGAYSTGWDVYNAFSANTELSASTNTFHSTYIGNGETCYILLDLGASCLNLDTYAIISRNDPNIQSPTSVKVYGSNDNTNFTLIDTHSGLNFTSNTKYTFLCTNRTTNNYRYFKFVFTASSSGYVAIKHIYLYYNNTHFLIKDGNNYEYTLDGNNLTTISNQDTLYNNLINYGMNGVNNISGNVITLINNQKYNISMLK